jgi:hypothetical protein
MLKTDETPPPEIIEAAEKVAQWFAERNVTDWVLGRCASRSFADQAIGPDSNTTKTLYRYRK